MSDHTGTVLRYLLLVTTIVTEINISRQQQCPPKLSSDYGYALVGREYKSFTTHSFFACVNECDKDDSCMSVNFHFATKTCELNTQTKESVPEEFKERMNSMYMTNTESRKPEYKHIGCFKDTFTRALPDYFGTFPKNIAIQKCAQLAKERGFVTFSVQYGGQCFTGSTSSQTYDKHGQATNCASGLGGYFANDVYSLISLEYKHIGCFKDTSDRALPDSLGILNPSIAIQECAQLAKERGFTTFAVQYGGHCFSGATASETYNKYGPVTNCANGLGGFWSSDVYSFSRENKD